MTILKVTIEPSEDVELVKKILSDLTSVKNVEEEKTTKPNILEEKIPKQTVILAVDERSSYEKILSVQKQIGRKKLLKNINNPVEWQRALRKEWDSDF